MLQLTIAAIND